MELDIVARRVGDGLAYTLGRLARLALGVAMLAGMIGLATFATGWWVFDGSTGWLVVGGLLCTAPFAAGTWAWLLVHRAAGHAVQLMTDVKRFTETSRSADLLIDYDTGQPIAVTSRSFGSLSSELDQRRTELPALWAGVRAITRAPGLAALSVLGMLVVGGIGTILLIGGVID